MPLPDTSPEFKAKVLTAGGYDPSKYSMDDDGNVSQIFDTSPSISTAHDPIEEPPIISTKPQQSSTAMQAAGHSALASILPTGAGLGTGALIAGALAPETGGLSLLGLLAPLLAGGAASYGTSKLQSAVLPDDINKQLATEQEEHPIASAVGGLAPSLPFFNPIKGAAELPSLIRSGGKALSRGLPALTDAEQALLANTAANVGVAGGQDIASQLTSDKPFDWSQLGVNVAGAGLLNSPTKLGSKVFDNFGARPRISDAQPTVSQADDIVTTKPAPVDYSTPSPLSGEAPNPTAGLMQNISTRPELRNGPLKNVAERSDAMANYRGNEEANQEDLARMEGEGGPSAPTTIEDAKELLAKSKEAQVAESSGGSTQPEPTREVYPPKELTDREIYTPKGALYQEESAPPAKTETNAQIESPPKVSDEDVRLLLRNAPYDYKQKVLTLAAKRGISVHEAMNIVNPETGKQVLGAAEVGNRKQTLSISKAQLDTPIHETSHQYLDDLLKSSSDSDKKLAQRALDIFGGDRAKAEEALVSKLGVEGTKRASVDLYGGKLDKFNAWFDDFKSRWKNNLGLANDADTIRHLSARTFHDAPYGTRGELVGREKYSALVGQYKETKDPEQKFAIQSDIEKLKNENGGMPPKQETKYQEEPAMSDDEKRKEKLDFEQAKQYAKVNGLKFDPNNWKRLLDINPYMSPESVQRKPEPTFSSQLRDAEIARNNKYLAENPTANDYVDRVNRNGELHTQKYGEIANYEPYGSRYEKPGNPKYQSESALRPEDVKLGDKNTLSKTQPDSNNESDASTLKPFRSETDTILAKDGSRAKPFTDAIQEHNNLREEYTAKYNDEMQKVVKPLSSEDKDILERTLIAENASDTSYRDTLKTPELQDAYDKLRYTMKQMQEDKIAANQPTYEMHDKGQSVPREAKIDPFYWPNNMSPEVIDTLKNHANSSQAEALKKDWTEFQAKHGMDEKASGNMLDNILGSYSKQTPNLAHFRGVDIEQGHGLPQSFMRPGIERNIERYTKRFSNARAYHDAVESQPSVAPLIGIKNDPWGRPFEEADSMKPLKSQEAQDAFHRMTGADYDANDSKVKAAERIGSSLILGPATSLHIYASTVANALTHAMPSEVAGMVKSMSSDIREGFDHAQKSGILSTKSFKRIVSDFFDAHSTATEKLNSLSDLIAKVSGRDALGNLAKAQAQIGGEFLVKSRIPLAKLGPESGNAAKQAIRFMKQVDPYWNPAKEYSKSDIAKMGSNFARSLHGHSSATQPSWMLKDSIIQPFVSLMSWNIAQTNAFMKNVYTPAIRDKNFTPLLMSTLGATLGGYIIKEAREKLMDKKSPIPSFSELAASDKGLGGNLPLIAYNLMAMTSFAGLGGILSTGARTAFDVAYKNPAQGAVFPLDEVISNTARTASQAYGALANSPLKDYPLIGTKAVGDLLRENIQLARIGLSWGDEIGVLGEERANKKKLNVEEGDLRRYKVAEGMPYDDQSSIDESNPYFNLGRKQFQKTRDIGEAMKELPDLISQAVDESNGNIETLKNKLRALKESSYPSMPSPERTPMTFWKYIQYLNETEGPEKASQRISEYMKNNMINKIKGSMVPSL